MAASMRCRTVSECSEGSGANDGELLQELGLLEAIYVHELSVIYNECGIPSELSVILHPATAGNVDQQYVCLTLTLNIPQQYPNDLPEIALGNSRGISDEHLVSLDTRLNQIAKERRGGAMLYELIEVAKESLTNNNTPSCQCVICLHGFTESDVFTKTSCYHYFHSQCLARYLRHTQESEEKPVCAVCREPVISDLTQLDDSPPPTSGNDVYTPDQNMRDMQKRMAALYRRQKDKGGIIDVEAENNKYLIHISQTPTLPHNARISPVHMQPVSQSERSSKTDFSKDEVLHQENKKLSAEKNFAGENSTERPRSPYGSNFKQGGRGRGSRGRNYYPKNYYPKNYYPKSSRSDRGYRSPSENVHRPVKKFDENLDQSQAKDDTCRKNCVDQSQESPQDSEILLAGEDCRKEGRQCKENQSKHRSVKLTDDHSKENPTKNFSQKASESHKDLRDDESTFHKNVDETKRGKDKESVTCSEEVAAVVQKSDIEITEGGSTKHGYYRGRRNRPELRKYSGTSGGELRQTTDRNKSSRAAERYDGAETQPEIQPRQIIGPKKFVNSTRDTVRKSEVDNEKDGARVVSRGGERKPNWHTNRDRGIRDYTESYPSGKKDSDQVQKSKVTPELDARERVKNKTREGAVHFEKSKPAKSPPPGFGEIVDKSRADTERKTVKPPPGFEHVAL